MPLKLKMKKKKLNKKYIFSLFGVVVAGGLSAWGMSKAFLSDINRTNVGTTVGTVSHVAGGEFKESKNLTRGNLVDNITFSSDELVAGEAITRQTSISNLDPGDVFPFELNVKNTGTKSSASQAVLYLLFDNGQRQGDEAFDTNGTPINDFLDIDGELINYGEYSNFYASLAILENKLPQGTLLHTGIYYHPNGGEYRALRIIFPMRVLSGSNEIEKNGNDTIPNTFKEVIEFQFGKIGGDGSNMTKANSYTMNQSFSILSEVVSVQYRNTSNDDLGKQLRSLMDANFVIRAFSYPGKGQKN